VSAYLQHEARPVLNVEDAADLRTEPSANLRRGMLAIFASPGLFNVLARWDVVSTQADDGTTCWKPNDLGALDPGRWLVFGGESAGPHTYVKRKVDGSIDGLTADFSNEFVRVNYDVGPDDPVPAALCGLSVDRGAIAGVERDRAAVVWDEAAQAWNFAFTTADDTALAGTHLPLVASLFATAGGFSATSGVLRVRQDEALTALVGAATYELVKGTAAGVATFGDVAIAQALLHADGDVQVRSVNGDVELRARELQLFDAAGANQLVSAVPASDYVRILGNLQVYNGASPILFTDIATAMLGLLGLFRQGNAALTASADLTIASTPQTIDETATTVATIPVPASGSVSVLVYVKGIQSDGSNGFSQLCVNSARRSGAGAPTLSQGASGIIITTLENTFAVVRPSFQFVISGNDLLLQVVGKAATTINWLPYYLMISR
jgi:hypothetical protein